MSAIFKMAAKNGVEIDNVEFLRYCGGHFENGDQ
jgi:hypothetical protein